MIFFNYFFSIFFYDFLYFFTFFCIFLYIFPLNSAFSDNLFRSWIYYFTHTLMQTCAVMLAITAPSLLLQGSSYWITPVDQCHGVWFAVSSEQTLIFVTKIILYLTAKSLFHFPKQPPLTNTYLAQVGRYLVEWGLASHISPLNSMSAGEGPGT